MLLSALLTVACSSDTEFTTLESLPYGDAGLEIDWAPGEGPESPARVRVRIVRGEVSDVVYQGTVAAAGEVTAANVRAIAERPPIVLLCLSGAKQSDLSVRIDTESRTVVEVERRCGE